VPLVLLPIIKELFERIAMDIVGPLPRSRRGNLYLIQKQPSCKKMCGPQEGHCEKRCEIQGSGEEWLG